MIDVEMTGDRELALKIGRIDERMAGILTRVIRRQGRATARMLRGEATSKLKRKTGRFAASVKEKNVSVRSKSVTGGAYFGEAYKATVHVGSRGTSKTIVPRKADYLAVPLPTAQTKRPRRTPDNFVVRTKAGNLLVAKRQATGGFLPMFVLKKSVRVPRRIFLPEIATKMTPRVKRDLEDSLAKETD